jgi:hypothetical protein
MARKQQKRDMSNVVAVGEIEGHVIEVLQMIGGENARYTWRALKGGQIVHKCYEPSDSIPGAIDLAIKHFYPDAVPAAPAAPTEDDFEALNALLYVGGTQQDIVTVKEARQLLNMFRSGMDRVNIGEPMIYNDLEDIEDILASAPGTQPDHIAALIKITELFKSQHDLLRVVLERSIQTLEAFLTRFE